MLTAAHGGQIICSEAVATLLRRDLPVEVRLTDLGPYRLRDVPSPERLYQVEHPNLHGHDFPPLNAEAGYADNLPLESTRFFGRESELAWLKDALVSDDIRLLTLTGPGGCGKTRLALQVARQLLEPFQGAVWFVPLGDLSDATLIGSAVLDAVRVPARLEVDPVGLAAEALSRQRSLLVLDNLEQLVEGGAAAVRGLLDRAPSLTCLVTSRHCLDLRHERELVVSPLPIPAPDEALEELASCPSVRLFVDRAQAARPDFQVTSGNSQAVAELCERLEGIPLALELAAARAQVLTPSQMLSQLGHRLDFLVSRVRDVDERHRTLRAAMEWSYQLLAPERQRFLNQLSVFRDGCTLEAAESVCGEPNVLDALLDLTDHSLVQCHPTETTTRYRLLESIREFAAEKLSLDPPTSLGEHHATFYVRVAQECAARADGPDEAEAFAQLDADLGNVRAAMDWAVASGKAQLGAELGANLSDFLWRRGYWQEHAERVGVALACAQSLAPGDLVLTARLLHAVARVTNDRGELDTAEDMCRSGLELVGDREPQWRGLFLNLRALVLRKRGDADGSRRSLEEGLPLFRQAGYPRGEGMALHNLALLAVSQGKLQEARELYERALPIRQRAGDLRGVAETQNNLGVVAEEEGRLDAAEPAYREALRCFASMGDALSMAVCLCNLGEIALRTDRPAEATTLLAAAEHALRHLGSVHAAHASECLSQAASQLGKEPETRHLDWQRELSATAELALQP